MGIEAIMAIGGMIFPPVVNLIKSIFGKNTPQDTANTLATTKPEILPEYVKSTAELQDANTRYFNRDIVGNPSQLIIDMRAGIRPIITMLSILFLAIDGINLIELSEIASGTFAMVAGNWIGTRIKF